MFSFLSGERKENQKRKPGTRLGWPAAPARRRGLVCSQKYFAGLFFRSLFFPEAKREPEKKAGNPLGLARRARPSAERTFPAKIFAGLFFQKSPAGKNRNRMMGGGLPDGLRASPSPLRFLFFGSFFSFSERKERTEIAPLSFPERKERTEKQPSGSKAASPAGGGGRCAGTISAAAPSCCRAR